MNLAKRFFLYIKPWLPWIIIIGGLQLTGQLGNIITVGQSAVLKTGFFNASDEVAQEDQEQFDYSLQANALDGSALNMDSLKGKVVFLNMWATWCGPCRAEMPTIQTLYNEVKDSGVQFVMLSIDKKNPIANVKTYIANNQYNFPVYILNGTPPNQLMVPSIPTTFVIDKKGVILRKEVGMRRYDTEKFKKFLLKEAEK